MRKLLSIRLVVILFFIGISCKEPFDPNIPSTHTNYLVVEGYINTNGITIISLSRTLPVKDSAEIKPDLNAQITIEGEDNSVFNVGETGNGTYMSSFLILNNHQKYRLHIKTLSGGEYLSEFVAAKPTPSIDSVLWKQEDKGVRIFVNTHDPQNNTRYYKWDYEETWEIHSAYVNRLKYVNGGVIERDLNEVEKLYYCYRFQRSSDVLVGSSVNLQNDVINEAPLAFIGNESEKTSVRYSILVKQYSLDRKAYDFYKMLKSNTESLGSVFDPLPSEIAGNITCVNNPLEKAVGYITAATMSEKRIFIKASDIHSTYSMNCGTVYVKNNPDSIKVYFDSQGYRPYNSDPGGVGPVLGYFSSTPECIDCTIRGTSIKPSFW